MALYEIRRACGHVDEVQIHGSNTRGQHGWRAEQLAEDNCFACKAAGREALNARAAEVATAAGWADLTGSTRQIAWAQTIRGDLVAKLAAEIAGSAPAPVADAVTDLYLRVLLRQTDASWWIDNRTTSPARLAARLATDTDRAALAALREVAEGRAQQIDDTEQPEPESTEPAADSPEAPPTAQAAIGTLRAAGWTVAKLAAEIGVHRSTVYRWQSGQRNPNVGNAAKLALLVRS